MVIDLSRLRDDSIDRKLGCVFRAPCNEPPRAITAEPFKDVDVATTRSKCRVFGANSEITSVTLIKSVEQSTI